MPDQRARETHLTARILARLEGCVQILSWYFIILFQGFMLLINL